MPAYDDGGYRQAVRQHNSIILLKSASCIPGSPSHLRSIHNPHKFEALFSVLHDHLVSVSNEAANGRKRVLIVVNGSKDLEVTTRLIKGRFSELYPSESAAIEGHLVAGLEGHADIVEFARDWREAFESHLVLITSSQSMLYLFAYGLVRMDELSHLIFDDCTMANSNHPFCVTMKSFYLPSMARCLAGGANETLPRVVGFADWPLVSGEESFMVKRDRMAKMLDFVRLYQSVVCPVADTVEPPAGYAWMAEEEIAGLREGGCFGQLRLIVAKGSDGRAKLEAAVESIAECRLSGPVLLMVQPEHIQPVQHQLPALLSKCNLRHLPVCLPSPQSTSHAPGLVLCRTDEVAALCSFLQNQRMAPAALAAVYMLEPGVDVGVLLSLLAFTAGETPLISIRGPAEIGDEAAAMAAWMVAVGASSPVDSLPFRRLRSLVGGYEAIARSAFLLADASPIHRRIPATGAMVFWSVSVQMLLCFCSYLPHIQSKGTGLRIHTMAVKRVNAAGKELDVERHFYMTRITLPPCLSPWIPPDRMQVQGPLTPSRFSSQTTAAQAALETLYAAGCLTDNLIIASAVLALNENGQQHPRELEVNPFDVVLPDEAGGDGRLVELRPEDITEVVPEAFQKDALWASLDEQQDSNAVVVDAKAEPKPRERFYVYLFKYEIGMRQGGGGGAASEDELLKSRQEAQRALKPLASGSDERTVLLEEDRLPADTLVHLLDEDVFSTARAGRTWCLVTRRPLVAGLKPVEIQIGATVLLKGTVEPLGDDDGLQELDEGQVRVLKALQAVAFGCINSKPLLMPSSLTAMEDEGEGEDEGDGDGVGRRRSPKGEIPWAKQVFYFVALAKRSTAGPPADVTDVGRAFELYKRFYGMLGKTIKSLWADDGVESGLQRDSRWVLDWEAMGRMVAPSARVNLLEHIERVKQFQSSHEAEFEALGPPPVFQCPNDPTREAPLVMDFSTFCLRRCIVYAPYNCRFYRVRGIHAGLTAASPFECRALPECRTYGDLLRLKYGLRTGRPDAELVRFKEVEGFSSLSRWLQAGSAPSARRRQRAVSGSAPVGSAGAFQPALVPEWIEVIPVPLALVRMAVLLPRAVHDVDRQCLIDSFYRTLVPPEASPLPPTAVLVQSMTGPTASLSYDYERLEILGDCLLKLLVSIDVFLRSPSHGEGKLSSLRQGTICNTNLYRVAARLELFRYARLTPFFGKLWCPPDIRSTFGADLVARFPFIPHLFDGGEARWALVAQANARAERRSALHHLRPDGTLIDRGEEAGERIALAGTTRHSRHKSTSAATPVLARFGHPIPPKCFADLVESILGAVFIGAGYPGAVAICRAFGLVTDVMLAYRDADPQAVLGAILGGEPSPATHPVSAPEAPSSSSGPRGPVHPSAGLSDVAPYQPGEADFPYAEIEAVLGYRFRHRRLLFVAMTHASVDATNSNERLEWLGDAALDWAITRHYYDTFDDARWMTPARITVTRQAAVCNEAFARIAVHHGLHRWLRINAPALQLEIEAYVRAVQAQIDAEAQEDEPAAAPINWNTSYAAGLAPPPSEAKDRASAAHPQAQSSSVVPPAPKAIGDLFEGLAGAVFIDLAFDSDAFSAVYLPLIRGYLSRHADPYDLPENPISDFWHDYLAAGVPPSAIEFRYPEAARPNVATCQILVRGRAIAEATAPNRVLARKFATRQAVIYIRSSGWRDFVG